MCRFDGKAEDVLNPKKKQLDKITPVHFSGLFDMM
jgi:aminoacyl tRNA synthase complex-interacting multifunctional protein 1